MRRFDRPRRKGAVRKESEMGIGHHGRPGTRISATRRACRSSDVVDISYTTRGGQSPPFTAVWSKNETWRHYGI